jgi:hypothetical protein
MGKGEIKKNGEGGVFKYDIFDIRTLVNAIMYPHPAQQQQKKVKKKRFLSAILFPKK